jgi:hypothetical protein
MSALKAVTKLVVKELWSRQPERQAGMVLSGGGSELATQIAAAADADDARTRKRDRGELVGVSFARLFPGAPGPAIARVEHAVAERTFGVAVRAAAQAVSDLLEALPVDETRAAARAALLGLDGREFLRLGRLAQKPDAMATEQDALFALYVLLAAAVKAERI